MAQTEAVTVRKQVVVDAPIERAFTVFTDRFGDFKPPEHNLLGAPISQTVFEPRVGGNIVDRAAKASGAHQPEPRRRSAGAIDFAGGLAGGAPSRLQPVCNGGRRG
jgi:hypothetical protein